MEQFDMEAVALMDEKTFIKSCFTLQSIKAMGEVKGTKYLKAIYKKATKKDVKPKNVE